MRIFTLLTILFLASTSYGQTKESLIDENIDRSTKKYKELFLAQDFQKLSDYASPKLIEYLKSKQDFVYLLTELSENAEMQGVTITDITFGNHSEIIQHKNEMQSVIPFELKLENKEKLVVIGAGIALISFDNGNSWHFTFQVIKDNAENNKVLGLNENIIIPSKIQTISAK